MILHQWRAGALLHKGLDVALAGLPSQRLAGPDKHAEIDQSEASVAKLTEEISDLTKAVAELDAAMEKATTIRQEEKEKNEQTISDSAEAQTAVAQALTVLKEFYAKVGEAAAFDQQPAILDSPYKCMPSENGGEIGMLEVIESDFARLVADTMAAVAAAQNDYDTFMTDSKVDKSAKKQDETQVLTVKGEDLEGTQKELDAALAYFDKLKPSCVDAGVCYAFWMGGDFIKNDAPFCQMNECIPEVVKAMRACIKETGESKLFSANITADDPAEMIARGKYVLSQFGPLGENTAFLVDGYVSGGTAITVARRKFPKQFLHYHSSTSSSRGDGFHQGRQSNPVWSGFRKVV